MKKIESGFLREKPAGNLHKVSDHVYWMKPAPPDRPSLCIVAGERYSVMLDAGSSPIHTRLFLNLMVAEGLPSPRYVVLTHWHWDHIFGLSELDIPIIAHHETAAAMQKLVAYDWSDTALDARVASGEEIAMCADNIKIELPAPRKIEIVLPDILFSDSLTLDLGGVTCQIQHLGGDHSADSSVILVEPDGVLFGGDLLYDAIYAPMRHYSEKLFPVLDALEKLEFTRYIEGHTETVMLRAEVDTMAAKMRFAGTFVRENGIEAAEARLTDLSQEKLDEDSEYFLKAFIAGRKLEGERQS